MYPPAEVEVIGLFVLAVLYGLYVATLVHCLRWLIFTDDGWKQRDRVHKLMLTATILIFLTSTINLGILLQHTFHDLGVKNWGPAEKVLTDLSQPIAFLIVDAVLIYRCWTVYANSWLAVCLPITFWVGSLACAVLNVFFDYVTTVAPETNRKLLSHIQSSEFLSGHYACNIATNLYSTSAIIYKILSVTNTSTGICPKRYHNTVRILAESGIVYTLMTAFSLIGTVLGSAWYPVWYPVECKYCLVMFVSDVMNFSTAGITFNLILIRVNQDRARVKDIYADTGGASKQKMPSGLRFRANHSADTSTHLSTVY